MSCYPFVRAFTGLLVALAFAGSSSALHSQTEARSVDAWVDANATAAAVADRVAQLIQDARKRSQQPPLHRTKASHQLLEEVCTAALFDHQFVTGNWSDGQFFQATNGHLDSNDQVKLESEAAWKNLRRLEVVAWPVADSSSSTAHFWVGVRLLAGPFIEFVVGHMSDDLEYRSVWKKNVAAKCRGAKTLKSKIADRNPR